MLVHCTPLSIYLHIFYFYVLQFNSYATVAVTGVPEARKDHALVMTKFASDCRTSMEVVTERLESTLGPDTGDLKVCVMFVSLFPSSVLLWFH
jgi:hypothetical protein